MLSGDEYYGDDVTSGPSSYSSSYLDDDMRQDMIDELVGIGYRREYLESLNNQKLDELYEQEFGS